MKVTSALRIAKRPAVSLKNLATSKEKGIYILAEKNNLSKKYIFKPIPRENIGSVISSANTLYFASDFLVPQKTYIICIEKENIILKETVPRKRKRWNKRKRKRKRKKIRRLGRLR